MISHPSRGNLQNAPRKRRLAKRPDSVTSQRCSERSPTLASERSAVPLRANGVAHGVDHVFLAQHQVAHVLHLIGAAHEDVVRSALARAAAHLHQRRHRRGHVQLDHQLQRKDTDCQRNTVRGDSQMCVKPSTEPDLWSAN